ncbi:MAG TPA: dihydrodipicolinate synthase family protein [Atribacterota bacterium]|nr:dihydrodipicolinate synthase family protein [Atribacterota bacterium]
MKKIDLAGIFPPIVTPFKKEEVAYDYLVENINKWNNSGLKGFVVLGSNGENVFLSEAEKIEVVKTVIKNRAKDKIIIVGSGCESARETIYLTNRLAASGAQAALIVTPFYYGGKMNDEALIKYYTVVADNAEIPVLLYNVPKFTGVNINPGVLSALAKHPNIIGIKDSSGNVNQLGQYLNEVDDNFNILVGTAGSLLGALTLGCKGGILALANIVPEKCVEIQQLIQAGKLSEARALQLRMIPVNHATTTTYGISGLKYAMDLLGYKGGETRLPLLPLKQEEKEKIRNILVKANLKVVSTP